MLAAILTWLIIGGIAGWLASLIMGTDARQGMLTNILVGIVGAFIGGFLYNLLFNGTGDVTSGISGFNIASLILATVGSVILLALMKMFRGSERTV